MQAATIPGTTMAKPLKLKAHTVRIKAPRDLVFQMMSHFGRGRLPGDNNESSKVLERDGNCLTVEFQTKALFTTYTTVEKVNLFPSERITFEHISGPLHYASEQFAFEDVDYKETDLTHSGEFIWSTFPFFGRFGGVIYTRPVFERTIVKHMAQVKQAAEARAARSRVFPRN